MLFLLDTCILSDIARKGQYPKLLKWAEEQRMSDFAVSSITMGELRYGVERLSKSRKRLNLLTWIETALPEQFAGRILPFDSKAADAWGVLRASAEKSGRPLPLVDGQLLAIAQANNLIFVTRNERDVEGHGISILNPY